MKEFAAKAAAHNNEIYRQFYAHLEKKDAEIIQLEGQAQSQAARLTEQETDLSASWDDVSQLRPTAIPAGGPTVGEVISRNGDMRSGKKTATDSDVLRLFADEWRAKESPHRYNTPQRQLCQ